jgi:hypothetical protein
MDRSELTSRIIRGVLISLLAETVKKLPVYVLSSAIMVWYEP